MTPALLLRARRPMERVDDIQTCDNGCVAHGASGGGTPMKRSATHEVEILDRHVCWLCGPCTKAWQRMWVEFGGCEVKPTQARRAKQKQKAAA